MIYLIEYAGEKRVYQHEASARLALETLGPNAVLHILAIRD